MHLLPCKRQFFHRHQQQQRENGHCQINADSSKRPFLVIVNRKVLKVLKQKVNSEN
jgi:hypothetical protein